MKKYVLIALLCAAPTLSNATEVDSYKYVIDNTGIQFYGHTTNSEFDLDTCVDDRYYICTEENREITDIGGGRGVVVKSCHSYRSPLQKVWVKTYAVDQSNWKFCSVDSFDNRLVVLSCPRVYEKKIMK